MAPSRAIFALLLILGLGALACINSAPIATPSSPATPSIEPAAPTIPAAVGTTGTTLSRYTNAEYGFTFEYPEGWALQELPGFISLASQESLLQPGATYSPDGALVIIAAGPASAPPEVPLETALDEAIAQLDVAPDAELVAGPSEIDLNGQRAIRAVVSGTDEASGADVLFYVTLIQQGEFAIVVSGTTRAENGPRFQPQIEAVAASLQLPTGTEQAPVALPETSGEITYGQTITGTIPSSSSISWMFQAARGDVINITAEPTDGSLDIMLDVVDSSDQTILPDGEVDTAFDVEEVGGLVVSEEGIYRVILRGYLGSTGGYKLTLAEATAAFGDVSPGAIITGFLDAGGLDAFTFAATEGVTLTLVAVPDTNLDIVLTVLDLTGSSLVEQDVGFAGEGEYAVFLPEETGQYLLQVQEFSGDGSGPYTLGIMTEATALFSDEAQISVGETAQYPVQLAAGQTLMAVGVPGEELDILLSVADPNGETVAQVDLGFAQAPEILSFTADADGEHLFQVSGVGESTGAFRLLASTGFAGPNAGSPVSGSPSNSFALAAGDVVEATLAAETTDSFAFTGQAGEENTFFVIPAGSIDPVVDVVNSAGTILLNVDNGFTGEAEILTFVPEESGEYQLRVKNFIGDSGDYVVGMLNLDEALLNESGTVGNNVAVTYDIASPDEVTHVIMLFPEEGFDAVVEILDSEGVLVVDSDSGIASGPETLLFAPPAGGNYTIRVRGFVNAGGSYQIVVVEF